MYFTNIGKKVNSILRYYKKNSIEGNLIFVPKKNFFLGQLNLLQIFSTIKHH